MVGVKTSTNPLCTSSLQEVGLDLETWSIKKEYSRRGSGVSLLRLGYKKTMASMVGVLLLSGIPHSGGIQGP